MQFPPFKIYITTKTSYFDFLKGKKMNYQLSSPCKSPETFAKIIYKICQKEAPKRFKFVKMVKIIIEVI
jgi:hypothetical protein